MRKILSYLKNYKIYVVAVVILVSLSAAGQLLLPDYMSKIIGEGIHAEYYVENPLTGELVSTSALYCETEGVTCTIVQTSDMTVIMKYGGIMLGVTLLSSIASIALMYVSSHVGSQTSKDIRKDLFKKVSEFSSAEAESFGTSSLITRSTNDISQVQNFVMMGLRMFLRIPIFLIGGIVLSIKNIREMTSTNELLYVLMAGVLSLIVLVAITFVLVLPLFKALQKKIDKMTLVTREGIKGVRVIRAFGQGRREISKFRDVNDDLTKTVYNAGKIMSTLNPAVNLIFNVVIIGILYYSYIIITNSSFTDYQSLGNISAVIQYSTQIMFSLLMLTMTFIVFPRAQVSAKRIEEVLDKEIIIKDEGNLEYDSLEMKGVVEFDDVCFKYGDAEENVLDHISFKALPGQTVAIIGSTGSGKSTIVNLIPRFFDVTCGTIKIDDINIKDLSLHKLRSLIGFVPQTATLLSGTIKDNIQYGNSEATMDEIRDSAVIAQAEEFIEEMDLKYDSIVDQGGVNLSGGQKQRLSIARAIVRRPKVYIFDDSFSALDFKTDSNLRKALKKITKESTVLLVAQRIGTIMDADQIIVIHDGAIVGLGKHKELLNTCEIYKEIAYSQLSEEELA
ncbi:MAG: ABC transporter ATP-binding protein/permease [Firmicutes bacterium]|nr:ABC transporter ATP-binding protein/permease [Bacillota bacterium]